MMGTGLDSGRGGHRMSNAAFGVSLALAFVAACWLFVVGHQLGWPFLDPVRYGIVRSSLYVAYPVAFMSACLLILAVLLSFKK